MSSKHSTDRARAPRMVGHRHRGFLIGWLLVGVVTATSGCFGEGSSGAASGSTQRAETAPEAIAEAPEQQLRSATNDAETETPPGEVALAPTLDEVHPQRRIEPAEASFVFGSEGGVLRAGEAALELPRGALTESEAISLALHSDVESLDRPRPPGEVLAVAAGAPWNPSTVRPIELTLPLNRTIEAGAHLELLAWQPAMRAFIVAGYGRVAADGSSATFTTRQLGELIVRPRAVTSPGGQERCAGDDLRLRERWPGGTEEEVVGLVPEHARLGRDVAFNELTDFRVAADLDEVTFKNEEVDDSARTRRDERDHQDEDYLMDPNLAAAVRALARLVKREWSDELTGEPAYELRLTEAYDSLLEHAPESTHYQGRAADITLSPVPPAAPRERRAIYGRLARLAVCAGFDYVLFENAYHIHASVVPTRYVFVTRGANGTHRVVTRRIGARRTRFLATLPTTGRLEDVRGIRWEGRGRLSVEVVEDGAPIEYIVELVGGGASRHPVDEAPGEVRQPVPAAPRTIDGLREVIVRDGGAWLVNATPLPPLGTRDAEGRPIHIEYPLPLRLDDEVVAVAFRARPRLAEALQSLDGPGLDGP